MRNSLKTVLALIAISMGISILFLQVVYLCSGEWNEWIAAFRKPVDLFSESCDMAQFEEMDVVRGTIHVLYGRYDYTYDDYVSDIAYYYVLPIDMAGRTYYMGIRETKGRKNQFRELSVQTGFDVKPPRILYGSSVSRISDRSQGAKQAGAGGNPIFVEGFLRRMNERQYGSFLKWFEKAGCLERTQPDGDVSGTWQERFLPYYIAECDIASYRKRCVAGLIETASGIVLIAAGAAVLIRRRKRHNRQTYVIIDGRIYAKVQLGTVNQLIQNIELMQAIQELSRLTGLDMTAAEKIVRRWDSYWY